jgi:hypothetical protein
MRYYFVKHSTCLSQKKYSLSGKQFDLKNANATQHTSIKGPCFMLLAGSISIPKTPKLEKFKNNT